MNITTSPTRDRFPLSTKKIVKKTIASSIVWIFLLGLLGATLAGFGEALSGTPGGSVSGMLIMGGVGALILLVIIIFLTWLYQRWYFATYFYDLTDRFVIIRKGPITPFEVTIPYERIQDVYVDQDLLDRFMGLYDVHLSSATASSGAAAHIDGVEKVAADGLRALLLDTVSQRITRRSAPPPPQV